MKQLLTLLLIALFINLQAQQSPTHREIFDFEIGDEFHWEIEIGEIRDTSLLLKYIERWKVTDKYFSSGNDTLFYIRNGMETILYEVTGDYTPRPILDTMVLYDLDSTIATAQNYDTVLSDPLEYNGRKQYIIRSTQDTANYEKFIEGCGIVTSSYKENLSIFVRRLRYFKKGNDEWGNKFVGVEDNQKEGSEIKIYPNPATNQIFIESQDLSNADIVELFDVRGQVQASQFQNRQGRLQLDVSDLAPGLYFIRLIIGNKVIASHTIVKQ